jgi:hypothetical protein
MMHDLQNQRKYATRIAGVFCHLTGTCRASV